jgi:chromosomal replication initiation ATPase DnaA
MPGLKYRDEVKKQIDRFDTVIKAVCFYFNITETQIMARDRNRKLVEARFISYYHLHFTYGMAKSAIGNRFKLDHTTILYGIRRCKQLMVLEPEFNKSIVSIQSHI